MKRGRKPKPTNLKVLEGNPGKRPLNEAEPKPAPVVNIPNPPSWLNAPAKTVWKRLAPELERLGLLTVVDIEAFTGTCQAFGVWVECEKYVKRYGRTYEYTNQGGAVNITTRPEVKIGQKALDQFRSFVSEFGLTPAARTNIEIKPDEIEDPMGSLLSGVS